MLSQYGPQNVFAECPFSTVLHCSIYQCKDKDDDDDDDDDDDEDDDDDDYDDSSKQGSYRSATPGVATL